LSNNFHVLSDSTGSIKKILFHQTAFYRENKQMKTGIFKNLLGHLNKTCVKPDVFVCSTYRTDSEKMLLEEEAREWEYLVNSLNRISIKVNDVFWTQLPYAQDTCIVLNSDKPTAIITNSTRYREMEDLLSVVKELIKRAGLKIFKPKCDFSLEGGHIYSCAKFLLYSNPEDREVIKTFKQKSVFVDSLISWLIDEMVNILHPGVLSRSSYDHVDLILSILERDNVFDVFYVDFKETALSSPIWYENRRQVLLQKRFREWDVRIQKVLSKIEKLVEDVRFHKVPGVIGYETFLQNRFFRNEFFVYSGANLLFHSVKGKTYAFYLKFPSMTEEEEILQINGKIESAMKDADIIPIAIVGNNDFFNWHEILNSAGTRCLVKVLDRSLE